MLKLKNDFNDFLESKYDEIDNDSNNANDEFCSRRDSWFEGLDGQELIDYADEFGAKLVLDIIYSIPDYQQTIPDGVYDKEKKTLLAKYLKE